MVFTWFQSSVNSSRSKHLASCSYLIKIYNSAFAKIHKYINTAHTVFPSLGHGLGFIKISTVNEWKKKLLQCHKLFINSLFSGVKFQSLNKLLKSESITPQMPGSKKMIKGLMTALHTHSHHTTLHNQVATVTMKLNYIAQSTFLKCQKQPFLFLGITLRNVFTVSFSHIKAVWKSEDYRHHS